MNPPLGTGTRTTQVPCLGFRIGIGWLTVLNAAPRILIHPLSHPLALPLKCWIHNRRAGVQQACTRCRSKPRFPGKFHRLPIIFALSGRTTTALQRVLLVTLPRVAVPFEPAEQPHSTPRLTRARIQPLTLRLSRIKLATTAGHVNGRAATRRFSLLRSSKTTFFVPWRRNNPLSLSITSPEAIASRGLVFGTTARPLRTASGGISYPMRMSMSDFIALFVINQGAAAAPLVRAGVAEGVANHIRPPSSQIFALDDGRQMIPPCTIYFSTSFSTISSYMHPQHHFHPSLCICFLCCHVLLCSFPFTFAIDT